MNYTWQFIPQPVPEAVDSLSKAINVSATIASILVQRGVSTFDQAKYYFRPQLENLHDPFLMKDMDKAVNRLSEAVAGNQKVMIYGDYDVDGSTSVAMFYGFMNQFHTNCIYYIPDRYSEGYGVSTTGIEFAKEQGVELIITIDCGIKSIDKVDLANSYGIDVIICDHHLPDAILPKAVAILDAKQTDCNYPYDELCGCGVAFKLMCAFSIQNDIDLSKAYDYIDLVAIATASDIVPITGENRILAYHGLQKLMLSPRPGIKELIHLCGYKGNLTITNIVFGIGPRINAAGRIDHAHGAVKLLLASTEEEAQQEGFKINDNNSIRRDVDASITEEALAIIEENNDEEKVSTVLFKKDWHKGVIGIVASRCIEHYYRPTIILTESNGKATGSARSVIDFNIHDAISECSDLLSQFGGHAYAAGLTMPLENIIPFQKKFNEVVKSSITPDLLIPKIAIDQVLSFDQINPSFFSVLSQMGPFGPKNMQPVFVTENVVDSGKSRIVKEKHLKISVIQNGIEMNGIAFGMGHLYDQIATKQPFHICYNLEENHFNDTTTLQLMIKDIKFHS